MARKRRKETVKSMSRKMGARTAGMGRSIQVHRYAMPGLGNRGFRKERARRVVFREPYQ